MAKHVRLSYRERLFRGLPLYGLELVRESSVNFDERDQMTSPDDVARILHEYFRSKTIEEFVVLLLDTANTAIGLSVISAGGLAAAIVEPRAVFQAALMANAASIVCAHNHPSGNPEPSRDDARLTRTLVEAGKVMGITVLDHLIVTADGHTSLAERGLM